MAHQPGTELSRDEQQPQDGVAVRASESTGGADRATFNEALESESGNFGMRCDGVPRQFGMRFTECGIAGLAEPALDAPFTKVTELLAGLVLAFYAGHGLSPLDCCGVKPENEFDGLTLGLIPEFRISPAYGSRPKRGNLKLVNWWRRHCHLPVVSTAQRLGHAGPFVLDTKKSFLLQSFEPYARQLKPLRTGHFLFRSLLLSISD